MSKEHYLEIFTQHFKTLKLEHRQVFKWTKTLSRLTDRFQNGFRDNSVQVLEEPS